MNCVRRVTLLITGILAAGLIYDAGAVDTRQGETSQASTDIGPSSFISKHDVQYNSEFFCGPLCLKALLKIRGVDTDILELARLSQTNYNGSTFWGLKMAAEEYPVTPILRRLSRKPPSEDCFPFIALSDSSHHFILALGMKREKVLLLDAATSETNEQSWADFIEEHSDLVLEVRAGVSQRNTDWGRFPAIAGTLLAILLIFFSVLRRKRARTALCSAVLGLLISLPCGLCYAEAGLSFAEEEWDFGSIPQFSDTAHSFQFRNDSSSPVKILSVKSGCKCLTPKNDKVLYAPGEEGEIAFEFAAGDRRGASRNTIVVKTDSPSKSSHLLEVSAFIAPKLEVVPNKVVFPSHLIGSKSGMELLTIRNSEDRIRLKRVSSEQGLFIVAPLPDERNYWRDSICVTVQIADLTKTGELTDRIVLDIVGDNSEPQTMKIPVVATITENYAVGGSKGALGVCEIGQEYQETVPLSFVTLPSDISITSVKGEGLAVRLPTPSLPNPRLLVSLKPESPGLFSGEVVIKVSMHGQSEIRIPITAWIEE